MNSTITEESDRIIVTPIGKHTSTVFFLHGLGGQYYGGDIIKYIQNNEGILDETKFVFLQAPNSYVRFLDKKTLSWYDIYSRPDYRNKINPKPRNSDTINANTLMRSIQWVRCQIEKESSIVDPSRICLAGFSQGGTVTLGSVLFHDGTLFENSIFSKLAGVSVFSGWCGLPDSHMISEKSQRPIRIPPLFWSQGSLDTLVSINDSLHGLSKVTARRISEIEYHVYTELDHRISSEVFNSWLLFLQRIFSDRNRAKL